MAVPLAVVVFISYEVSYGGLFMDRFLFAFGLIIFASCFIFFVMNFVGEYDGMVLILTLFGMLNASIAMGVAEILSVMKRKQNKVG